MCTEHLQRIMAVSRLCKFMRKIFLGLIFFIKSNFDYIDGIDGRRNLEIYIIFGANT